MRRVVPAIAVALLVTTLVPALSTTPASGARRPLRCDMLDADGRTFRMCTGLVTSKDGTELLDVDVTLPARGRGPFPLIVMLHGTGGSKTEMESDTVEGTGDNFHQNNLWFASRGYAVMTYTTRGYKQRRAGEIGNECLDSSVQAADHDPALYDLPSPACLPHVPHKKHEVRDTQHLIGRLVDGSLLTESAVRVSPTKIGVYGRSYGGGHTWILTRLNTWRSPEGAKVRIAAAVPNRGWTDLPDALFPNGRARPQLMPPTSVLEREAERPGVLKESYVDGFYVALQVRTHGADGRQVPGYLETWRNRFKEGEPYNDAVVQDAVHKLLVNRSAYYIRQRSSFDTAILGLQSFTDQVFTASQVVQMFNRLRYGDPDYPISMYLGDAMGHPIAQNKPDETAYMAGLVNAWFDYYLRGEGPEPDAVAEARTFVCGPGSTMGRLYRAEDWSGLMSSASDFNFEMTGPLTAPVDDPHAAELNPIQVQNSNRCRETNTEVAAGNVAGAVTLPTGLDMLGMPTVTFDADPSAADMYVAAHLWDVDSTTGRQTLVDRGVYRLGSDALQDDAVMQLFGNAYSFLPGHELKLELTADDSPTFRRSNATGTIEISDVSLSVPLANPAALVAVP